jgi:hypothetical protein
VLRTESVKLWSYIFILGPEFSAQSSVLIAQSCL